MLEKIHHLGYAVASVEAASRFYRDSFGVEPGEPEIVEGQGIVTTVFEVGDSMIELMQPTHPDTPVARFLSKRGAGFHHVAFQVGDIEAALDQLKRRGVELVDEGPRAGAGGTRTVFIHPKGAFGVLTELVESPHKGR